MLLGAIAASGVLPIPAEAFRAAIRAEGKAVDANLRGFEAGLDKGVRPSARRSERSRCSGRRSESGACPDAEASDRRRAGDWRLSRRSARRAGRGHRAPHRLPGRAPTPGATSRASTASSARRGADGAFIRELARHLAVRMSVEDVIRVAQLKLREARLARVAQRGARRAPATSST